MVRAVDERDPHGRPLERSGGEEAAEAAPDDHDVVPRVVAVVHGHSRAVHDRLDVEGQGHVPHLLGGEPPDRVGGAADLGPQGPLPRLHPVDQADGVQARAVGDRPHVGEHVEQRPERHGQPRLLLDLPSQRVRRALAVLDAASGQEPAPPHVERRGGPGQQQSSLGVAAHAVGGDPLALLLRGHTGDAGPHPGRPPSPPETTLAGALAARTERGAHMDTAAELEAIRRLKYAVLPHAGPQAVRRARRAADRGRHRLLRGRQDRARGALGHRLVALGGPGRPRHRHRAPRPPPRDHLHLRHRPPTGTWYLQDRVIVPAADVEIAGTAFYERPLPADGGGVAHRTHGLHPGLRGTPHPLDPRGALVHLALRPAG